MATLTHTSRSMRLDGEAPSKSTKEAREAKFRAMKEKTAQAAEADTEQAKAMAEVKELVAQVRRDLLERDINPADRQRAAQRLKDTLGVSAAERAMGVHRRSMTAQEACTFINGLWK